MTNEGTLDVENFELVSRQDDDSDVEIVSVDDPIARARQVLKDIRQEVTSLRRTAKTGDKKQKKESQEKILQLEIQEEATKSFIESILSNEQASNDDLEDKQNRTAKINTSRMKKQAKKETAAKEQRKKEIEAAEIAAAMPKMSQIERAAFEKVLDIDNLRIHEIDPDGNCLFAAIAHQLETRCEVILDQRALRFIASEHILRNAEKYQGFVDSEDSILEYCEKLKGAELWGGHLELDALCSALNVSIAVYQADAPPLAFDPTPNENVDSFTRSKEVLKIAFQKYAYSLGEHYDSLVDN